MQKHQKLLAYLIKHQKLWYYSAILQGLKRPESSFEFFLWKNRTTINQNK